MVQRGGIYAEQVNGVLYEVDQLQARRKIEDREDKTRQRKGGF
jgi:hypothetical protein